MPFTEAMVAVVARDHWNASSRATLKTLNEARIPRMSTMLRKQMPTMT